MEGTNRKLVVTELSTDFRKVTQIVSESIPSPSPSQLLVINKYLGINASEINFTSGKYSSTPPTLPFAAGLEAIGSVVAVGSEVTKFKVGDHVTFLAPGSFAEYVTIDQNMVYPVPSADPKFLSVPVSGLTASIALERSGRMTTGEKILVTAAAGATGIYAVQLAKLAGNHVIGTCSSDEKVEKLKQLGCARVINYKKENLHDVLRKEYPQGVDIVYECVGGETFQTCVNNLAVDGRLIIVGMVSTYQTGEAFSDKYNVRPVRLLSKSAAVVGFFLNNYPKFFASHYAKLLALIQDKKIEAVTDTTTFNGLEQIADAVDHLYQGKNIGKIYVTLPAAKNL